MQLHIIRLKSHEQFAIKNAHVEWISGMLKYEPYQMVEFGSFSVSCPGFGMLHN